MKPCGQAAGATALKRHVQTDGPAPARQFTEPIVLRDGSPALMRAIRPDDRERLQTAFLALDRESVYLRYFMYKRELSEADLDRLCNPDFALRVVLVVTVGADAGEVIVGCGSYVAHAKADGSRAAEVAFAADEKLHGEGGDATQVLAAGAGMTARRSKSAFRCAVSMAA